MRIIIVLIASIWLALPSPAAFAQKADASADQRASKSETIQALALALRAHYVFPENAPGIVSALEVKMRAGRYDKVGGEAFADRLTSDLIEITGDKHFSVSYKPDQSDEPSYDIENEDVAKRNNFGFERLEILPGNIGYVRLDYFANPQQAYDVATGAMQFVENTDALIFDLRYNRGGHMEMVQLLASYLYSGEKDQLLFDYFYNDDGKKIERGQWVLAAVPGKRTPEKPVYVLTSSLSFSAAEWFASSLKELDRATIVGETTSGAAHSVALKRVNDGFQIQVPIGVTRGPVSRSDFEGKGVSPNHSVPSHRALEKAYELALEDAVSQGKLSDADWLLPFVRAGKLTYAETAEDRRHIVGKYAGREITLEDGRLIYRWGGRYSLALTPLGNGLFAAEGAEDYRFRLVRPNGQVTGLAREFREGGKKIYEKTE